MLDIVCTIPTLNLHASSLMTPCLYFTCLPQDIREFYSSASSGVFPIHQVWMVATS